MKLVIAPDPILETALPTYDILNADIPEAIAAEMILTMKQHNGLGLAANQVNVPFQIFVMKPILNKEWGDPLVVINPIIKGLSEETAIEIEGCLSYPSLYLKVRRPISCIVEFDTLDFNNQVLRVETQFNDIDARIFLHEYDHLHGIQFVDRVSKIKLQLAKKNKQKRIKHGRA